jgi:hypothetical protein
VAACLFVAGAAAAQYPNTIPIEQARQDLLLRRFQERQDYVRRIQNYTFPYNAIPREAPLPFHLGNRSGLQQLFPAYEGLPTYPGNVPGYGGYPGAGGQAGETWPVRGPSREKNPGAKDRLPSWIQEGAGARSMRATAQQAVLVRVVDRVWFRAPDEPAFVPLVFHDRFKFTTVGAQVQVRGKGEFHLVMHAGGHLRSRGPCAITVTGMDEKAVALQFGEVDQLWIQAGLRPFRLAMPDGTAVEFTDTLLHIERRGDRCRLANLGKSPVRYTGPAGGGELQGPRFIELWTQPAVGPAVGDALTMDGVLATPPVGETLTIQGGAGGRVSWSGATFQVGGGSTLAIRPLDPIETRR